MVELNDQNIKAIFDTLDDAVELKPVTHGNSKCYDIGYSLQAVVSIDDSGYVAFREVKSKDGKHYTENFLRTLKVYGFVPTDEWLGYKSFSKFQGNSIFEVIDDISFQIKWELDLEFDMGTVEELDDEPDDEKPVSLKIYVASSWRNKYQQGVVKMLREWGHEVYDFKHPEDNQADGFRWSDVDKNWQQWTPREYKKYLKSEKAEQGFNRDFNHLMSVCLFYLAAAVPMRKQAG